MKRTIALFLLLAFLIALCGCAGNEPSAETDPSAVTDAAENAATAPYVPNVTEKEPLNPYEGEIPEDLFGIYDEESYTNSAFGVKYLRDGSWAFQATPELAARTDTLRNSGYLDDMSAQNGQETLGFALAIPSVQYGSAMTEEEYAQAVKDASARNYAGADYDVISAEIGTAEFGGEQHACFYLAVAANGMVFYHAQILMQRGDFIGIIRVSALTEEGRTSLLARF